jgi:hypothetical protein
MWTPADSLGEQDFEDFKREFAKRCRFLVDESLGIEAARVIRSLGWNAAFAAELDLIGKDDTTVFSAAWSSDRVILTHDHDFLDDRRFPQNRNPGLVVLPGASGGAGPLEREVSRLLMIVAPYREPQRHTKILVGESGEWTIRRWVKYEGRHIVRRLRFDRDASIWERKGPPDGD